MAQQILSILSALSAGQSKFHFEGQHINLVWSCGIFITMNPGRSTVMCKCSHCSLYHHMLVEKLTFESYWAFWLNRWKEDHVAFIIIILSLHFYCFLGYAGRTELPDNLKSMFRPISMVVPDSTLIAEIILFGEGFNNCKVLPLKMYTGIVLEEQCKMEQMK